MTNTEPGIVQGLQLLQNEFAHQLPDKLKQLETTWNKIEGGNLSLLSDLHRQAHSFTGSGATFGFIELSRAARLLEQALQSLLDTGTAPGEAQYSHISKLLQQVHESAKLPPSAEMINTFGTENTPSQEQLKPDDARLIYLIEDDTLLAEHLATQINHFGYTVHIFSHTENAREHIQQKMPAAIIADISFAEGEKAGIESMLTLRQEGYALPALIFISSRKDFLTRLEAIRAGGMAYFGKPVDIGGLIDKLDLLTSNAQPEPFRVLVVENSATLAEVYAKTLGQAGMVTRRVTDPMQVMEALDDFSPELILMDINMPGANGEEVAQVLRQQEIHDSVPIVFLSGETDKDRQLVAMSHGGDDFLVKPIQADHLISSVGSRIERYRVLRNFMIRDSLTGLLNHTKIKEQLSIEIERAKRQERPLSFAMIDLDHFKNVNDTYGHPVGDKVLKSLARLLQQRLRKVDVIGRYGGEEFAVILTDTSGPDAVRTLDGIRKDLAEIRQHGENAEFSVTFSCGVASYPDFATPEAINNAADKALYRAKHDGRNRVVLVACKPK
ncbi:MAG: diguanylate cyclase [Gammaproteobacteria bacterium]|nr:diguanylate cyclase [Gammaproteobacteria bacterium]MBU1731731.1 diguanylate cyclase [Gammaproteobacteria bacterium]MBU1892555.1 diguanylate cyclase [Gammaproteobacteria bacterium]